MNRYFGCDINFTSDIRKGDHFQILYEKNILLIQKLLLAISSLLSFLTKVEHITLRFTNKIGYSEYYSPEGYSMQKTFIRTPVTFTHVSSRFTTNHHEIAHKGVDYAARRYSSESYR